MEEDLATMRHKRSLMKIYMKKLKEMDNNITLDNLLHVICTDIMNVNYKEYLICYNGQKYDVFLAVETKTNLKKYCI